MLVVCNAGRLLDRKTHLFDHLPAKCIFRNGLIIWKSRSLSSEIRININASSMTYFIEFACPTLQENPTITREPLNKQAVTFSTPPIETQRKKIRHQTVGAVMSRGTNSKAQRITKRRERRGRVDTWVAKSSRMPSLLIPCSRQSCFQNSIPIWLPHCPTCRVMISLGIFPFAAKLELKYLGFLQELRDLKIEWDNNYGSIYRTIKPIPAAETRIQEIQEAENK